MNPRESVLSILLASLLAASAAQTPSGEAATPAAQEPRDPTVAGSELRKALEEDQADAPSQARGGDVLPAVRLAARAISEKASWVVLEIGGGHYEAIREGRQTEVALERTGAKEGPGETRALQLKVRSITNTEVVVEWQPSGTTLVLK